MAPGLPTAERACAKARVPEAAPVRRLPPATRVLASGRMRWAAVGCLCVPLLAVASRVDALEGDGTSAGWFGAFHPEVAARLTYSPLSNVRGSLPLAGDGFGARAGLSYLGLYGGLSYMGYFSHGGCLDTADQTCGLSWGRSFGFEGGYGRTFFRILTVRGQIGIGDYLTTAEATGSCPGMTCSTGTLSPPPSASHGMYVQPEVLVALTPGPFVIGTDASVLYMPSAIGSGAAGSFAAFMLGLQWGVRL